MTFDQFPRGTALYDAMKGNRSVDRIAWFTHGFFKMSERHGRVIITDLRMGQEPYYSFNFVVGQRQSPTIAPVRPVHIREQHNVRAGVSWIWRRMWGQQLPPPR